MIERFEGIQGKTALVEALMQQRLVLGDMSLAAKMAELGTLRALKPGEILIQHGATDNDVYFIIAGRFSMTVHGREVSQRSAHEHIGEMASIMPSLPRAATGTVAEQALVLQLSALQFNQLADKFPRLWRNLACQMAQRLQQRNAHVQPINLSARVFIICSVEALEIARAVENHFQHDKVFVKVWTEGVFRASSYPLESLEAQLDEADFAIAIAQPDDNTKTKGVNSPTPRDNVIFELGMFVGRLGRKRSFLLEPKGEEVKLPSDLSGLTTIGYKTGLKKDLAALLGPACNELRDQFTEMGPR